MPKTNASALTRAEDQRRAVNMRMGGATYPMIAAELGVSLNTARSYVERAMKESVREAAEELRTMQVERMNAMLLRVWPKAMDPEHDRHEWAVGEAQRLIGEINKLEGIVAPEVVKQGDVNVGVLMIDGAKPDYIDKLMQMSGVKPAELQSAEPKIIDAEVLDDVLEA